MSGGELDAPGAAITAGVISTGAITPGVITTGVTGRRWRASIAPDGSIHPWDGSPPLGWYVAGDDRWYVPSAEPTLRQRRIDGTPVVETRLRIPGGDAVHRAFSVADGPGYTVVEVTNDSNRPMAVAFDRAGVLTERPPADIPIRGIELPAGSFVLPVGHRASVRVALVHDTGAPTSSPASDASWAASAPTASIPGGLPSMEQVVRGWRTLVDRAGRFEMPDGDTGASRVEQVVAERCELVLGVIAHAEEDPVALLLGLDTIVRMGERPDPWIPELAAAVERLARSTGWDVDAALAAAGRVLHRAGDDRALGDLEVLIARRRADGVQPSRDVLSTTDGGRPEEPPAGVRGIAWFETMLVDDGRLLPFGFPAGWLGANFEVHGLPAGIGSTVSFAVRWHGPRPAVLWEVVGAPVELTAPAIDPDWRTTEPSGEALWPEPPT